MCAPPQAGQTKPSGQRRSNRKVAQLVSSGKLVRNSFRDRALATESSPRAVAARESYLTTCSVTWDNGISLAGGVYEETSGVKRVIGSNISG
jgi:hypothetical protein